MKSAHWAVTLGLALVAGSPSSPARADCLDHQALLSEDAGALDQLPSAPWTVNRQYIRFVPAGKIPGDKAIRVTYEGSDIGSPRVGANVRLRKPAREATLTYTVTFERGFQFVRGGKLPGLGPEQPVTGGREVTASGWSVRPVFRADGTLGLYIYHQDMKGRYGSGGTLVTRYPVSLGTEHRVELQVTLNSAPASFDGSARLFVDGRLVEEAKGLRYFASAEPSLVSRLLFQTFFGGSGPSYAPRVGTQYATVHAQFDHLKVCDATN